MRSLKWCGWAGSAAILLLAAPVPARLDDNEIRVRLEARLDATDADPLASGKAQFELRIRDDAVERVRLSVEVEDVATAGAVTFVAVGVRGDEVVEVVLGTLDVVGGGADLNLDSRDGDFVPFLEDGDVIAVRDADDGTLLLSGALRARD